MKHLLLILASILCSFFCYSQDYNYEFITDGNAFIKLSETWGGDTTLSLTMQVRVIKYYNNLKIVSNRDFGNIKFAADIAFVGIKPNKDLIYYYFTPDNIQYWIHVNPSDGLIFFKDIEGNLITSYGTRFNGIPIEPGF